MNFLKVSFFFVLISITSLLKLNAQINFPTGSQYKYLKGIDASTLPNNWMNAGFNDSGWLTGNAPFRYGDGSGGTELTDMINTYSTVYLRTNFTATSIELIKELSFITNYDDGFIIWINGSEVFRRGAPEVPSYNAFATELHESGELVTIKCDSGMVNLIEGENLIAIQGFNISLESSDFYFDLQIHAVTATPEVPDSLDVIFNTPAGFYNSPFNLNLTSPDNTLNIVYTIDGSNPQNSATAIVAGTSAQVTVDPGITEGRATTPAFIVRASLSKSGFTPSKPVTRTYIFVENVKTQAYPGGNWPNYNVNGQTLQYPMYQEVVQSEAYKDLIDDALLDIPTISIVTDLENLFDPSVGIFVNAWGHGLEWERFSSVELIDPSGNEEGFQVNAGLRIRGGYSRNNFFPKHGFRLFFRQEYGAAKLEYPLFGDEGIDHYDKIDLRCEQNYSWANGGWQNTMVREVFSRDSQRDMAQPYTRSRYYHLYLNGMYWGIYQTQERSEARFASDYLGGKTEDYDVLKVNTEGYQVEATDGFATTWQQIYTLCNTGFANNTNYYKLEGKDANGINVPGQKVLVDIDNLIDYMLVIFYTGNFDAPVSAFGGNSMANNFYAIYNRNELSQGFKFFCHDSEHSLMVAAYSPGIGINENRVTIPEMNISSFSAFNPQWLHFKLTSNAEYRQRFADRVALHMTNNGALTPTKCTERFNSRASELNLAVIAESARWGGDKTKDNAWIPELNVVRTQFFPYRTNIVLTQLKNADLYSSLNPIKIKNQNTELKDNRYTISGTYSVTIDNPNTSGTIYFTLDGSDPRETGGDINSHSIACTSDTSFNLTASAVITARVLSDGEWSAVRKIDFLGTNDDLSKLKVTELHYHPQDIIEGVDTTDGKSFEFIEFKNTGSSSLNLSGLVLDSAVYYEFPSNTVLAPGNFYVIATKPSFFFEKYAMLPSGNCEGFFDNAGDFVLLNDSEGSKLISFTYDDHSPWPSKPDGDGYSLTSLERNPTGNPADEIYWTSSSTIDGSPFRDDYQYSPVEPVPVASTGKYIIYPNPATEYVFVGLNKDQTGLVSDCRVSIINLNGSVVYTSTFSESTIIDMYSLRISAGMYLIRLENDSYTQTHKLIYQP